MPRMFQFQHVWADYWRHVVVGQRQLAFAVINSVIEIFRLTEFDLTQSICDKAMQPYRSAVSRSVRRALTIVAV